MNHKNAQTNIVSISVDMSYKYRKVPKTRSSQVTSGQGWWRGVVGNAFRLKRSYSTPGPVSTAMGDCLRASKPSQCEACQLGRLSLLPSVGQ